MSRLYFSYHKSKSSNNSSNFLKAIILNSKHLKANHPFNSLTLKLWRMQLLSMGKLSITKTLLSSPIEWGSFRQKTCRLWVHSTPRPNRIIPRIRSILQAWSTTLSTHSSNRIKLGVTFRAIILCLSWWDKTPKAICLSICSTSSSNLSKWTTNSSSRSQSTKLILNSWYKNTSSNNTCWIQTVPDNLKQLTWIRGVLMKRTTSMSQEDWLTPAISGDIQKKTTN